VFLHGDREKTITQVFVHGGFVVRPHMDCPFPGLAGSRHLLRGPRGFIDPNAGNLRNGIVPNVDAMI
jgi:hypothetical protein